MKPRFKTDRMPSRIVRSGVITIADLRKAFGIPAHADVTITVPRGGDWSGMSLVVGEDIPGIDVRWEEIK